MMVASSVKASVRLGFWDHYLGPRVLGLDILRIFASVSIVAYHGNLNKLLGHAPLVDRFVVNDFLAVPLFFVLSGWLLTGQLLRIQSRGVDGRTLAIRFWMRRWFRTLAPYWICLVVVLAVSHGISPRPLLTHLLFLQTLLPPNAYSVSWSLVAEEWFYLALPLMVLLAATRRGRVVVAAVVLIALAGPPIVRALLLNQGSAVVLSQPQANCEGLALGALLAVVWTREGWRSVLQQHALPLAVVGLGCAVAANTLAPFSPLFLVAGIALFNLAMVAVIPYALRLGWPAKSPAVVVGAVTFLAELTYAIYLVHQPIIAALAPLKARGPLLVTLIEVLTILATATALHLLIERPCLMIRDRLWQRER
jgi:peptidoglycan/LPS O-acetylase OafA/YrhL